jgi:RHS repeat-associated protein
MESDGDLVEEYNYDAWGRRRNPSDWSYSNVPAVTYTQHGFTGHEHLDMFNLINMNGRVFDPEIARFVSPDPIIQDPYNILSYNRYTYCLNNPLKYTDPSGFSYRRFWELEMIDREAYGQGAQFMNNYVGWWSQYQHNRSTIYGPGMGNNGTGLNGVYYDWYSGKVRSTDNREIVNLGSVGVAIDWMTISYVRNNPDEFHIGMVYFTDGTKVDWNIWLNATSSVNEGNTGSYMNAPLWTLYTSVVGTWGDFLGESFKANPSKIISKTTGAIKTVGWIGEGISIGVAFTNLKNNSTSGNIARFQSSVGIAGMNVIPEVGSAVGFFTSVADNAGAFNWYYYAIDKISNATGFIIIPPGLYPFPILVPKIKR